MNMTLIRKKHYPFLFQNILNNIYNSILLTQKSNSNIIMYIQSFDSITEIYFQKEKKQTSPQIMSCPICQNSYMQFLQLFLHLQLYHMNFTFSYQKNMNIINVSLYENNNPQNKPNKQMISYILSEKSKHSYVCQTLQFLLDKKIRISEKLIKNKFFHSYNPFKQVTQKSICHDSQEQMEMSHFQSYFAHMIQQFIDVGQQQKQFYILWNTFINKIRYPKVNQFKKQQNKLIPSISNFNLFMKILKDKLRVAFAIHLHVLFCNGFLDKNDVICLLWRLQQQK